MFSARELSVAGGGRRNVTPAEPRLSQMPLQVFHGALLPTIEGLEGFIRIFTSGFGGIMSNMQLTLATKASQASLLPVLLVATSINEARPSPVINITYEDKAVLEQGDKAVVRFTGVSGTPVFGTVNAIQELLKDFPFLNSKDQKLVRYISLQPESMAAALPRLGTTRLIMLLGERVACSA